MPRRRTTTQVREQILSRCWNKQTQRPTTLCFGVMVGLLVWVSAGVWMLGRMDVPVSVVPIPVVQAEQPLRHPLTGAIVEEESPVVHVSAVVVENSVDARPQSGVDEAFMVIEAPVEGTITRWLALFSSDTPVSSVGPVRSARRYFVEWADGWNALFAHVGGSPEALAMIPSSSVTDVNEFFWGTTFWRSKQRSAPHNVYTESSRLNAAWDKMHEGAEGEEEQTVARTFSNEASEEGTDAKRIVVPYGHEAYDVTWELDEEQGVYVRSQQGRVSRMASGRALMAKTVAIVWTDISTIDNEGRKRIRTEGSGDARLVSVGRAMDAVWRREAGGELTFWDPQTRQKLLPLPGIMWIQVVSLDADVRVED